jgi:hypothetical protein
MTELTPGLIALKEELMPAFRRDHRRHQSRRKLLRTIAISAAVLAVLSGTALAAGGVTATQVTTLPVWDGTSGTFVSGTADGQYIYDLAGIGADTVRCGPADPDVATFITSTRPLTQNDLQGLLDQSSPSGLNSAADLTALGITSESGGCFPASVAGPLATPQTPSQAAAAQATTAKITAQLRAAEANGIQHGRSVQIRYVKLRGHTILALYSHARALYAHDHQNAK